MNEIHIIGRLTAAPEIKTFSDGSEYCNFNVAVDRGYKAKDGSRPCDFIPCTATKGTAALLGKYFGKGDGIALNGSMESRKYEKDGTTHTIWEVKVKSVEFLPSKGKPNGAEAELTEVNDTDGLPF